MGSHNLNSHSLKSLIQKLNLSCQYTLESAIGMCLSYTHYNVEIEHWLRKLIEKNDSDLAMIFMEYHIDTTQLIDDLTCHLKNFTTGNTRLPRLSQQLIDLMHEALLLATLEYNNNEIRSAYLLHALLKNNDSTCLAIDISAQFKKIPVDTLKENIPKLLGGSSNSGNNQNSLSDPVNSALERFTINLTEQACQGKLDPVIGRNSEISQMIDILMRRKQNNPILVGEAGVGKTAVVEGLALRIANNDVPSPLKGVILRVLDLGLLQAGASARGEFENRLKSVIAEVNIMPAPVILFIDEAHTLVGAGAQAGQGDAANLLKPALARGELRTIAATTWSEYKKYFEKDAALARRFQLIKIEEPNQAVAIEILQGITKSLEKYHDITILDEAVVASVKLSQRYLTERQLPDKAISILDTACARLSLNQSKNPVNAEAVAEVISTWTGIPLVNILRNDINTLLDLDKNLQKRIIGQDHALKIFAEGIATSHACLADPNKPLGIFLLVGPSGVGKTETAHVLADLLYGSDQNLTVINLSEFKEEHKVSLLMGSPPGYVGYEQGGVLTEMVRRKPYSLILLDEVEKAHQGIQDIFYQVFDKGILRDGQGQDINFKNTVIILTSNIGGKTILELCEQSEVIPPIETILAAIQPELLSFFKPAFLGRVNVIPYLPLQESTLKAIIKLQLECIQQRLTEHYQAEFIYDDLLIDYFLKQSQISGFGARRIEHLMNRKLLPELSQQILTRLADTKRLESVSVKIDENHEIQYQLA